MEQTSPHLQTSKLHFFQIISASICAAVISGLDTSLMTIILHISGQFKLINIWINNIGIEINCNPNYIRKLKIDLIKCIRHHQQIIQ